MSNSRRKLFVPAAFAGVVIWFPALVHPAAAETATPGSALAVRAGESGECAVASRRFELHPSLRMATPERVRAAAGARLLPLVGAACARRPIARDI